jgi:predicted TIM-barrel fold metal-dependent hydrolase
VRIAGVIDADGHVSEPAETWEQYLPSEYHIYAPQRLRDEDGHHRNAVAGELLPYIPQAPEWLRPGRPTGGFDPKARLVDMDSEGIDRSVLFPTVGLFFGGVANPAVEAVLCRAYNDWLADYCATDASRLVGVAMVAQGDIDSATAELRRAVGVHGFRGVMVRPNVLHDRTLDHPDYEPLWATAEELGVTVSVHEGTTLNVAQSGDRYETFAFRHACSHPHEQQMGMLSLICGGVLERHPDLRVVFLESGCGWVPAWLERLDEHMEHWRHTTIPLPLEPSEYFARQCFVSTEPDERMLPQVLELLGEDNVVFASDYPHPDGIFPGVVAALSDRDDLTDVAKIKILAQNPVRCFGLDAA